MKYEIELDDRDAELVVRWGEQTLSDIGRTIARQIAEQRPQPIVVGTIMKWRSRKANQDDRLQVYAVDGPILAMKRIDYWAPGFHPWRGWVNVNEVERVAS